MSWHAFYLRQVNSTVLGQVDHRGQDGNAAQIIMQDKTSETDHTKKRHFRYSAICQTKKRL